MLRPLFIPQLRPFLSLADSRAGPSLCTALSYSTAAVIPLSSSIRPHEQLLRRPGPCSWDNERTLETKSIDDVGRSSSFNPHRAHWNPLVYHVEIKSLLAVAKSIILWSARGKSRMHGQKIRWQLSRGEFRISSVRTGIYVSLWRSCTGRVTEHGRGCRFGCVGRGMRDGEEYWFV